MPYLRAARDGLFERHGLAVDLMEPASSGVDNVMRVADGGADFTLTSVAYFVMASAQRPDLAARFVAVITQRSPMAAVVLEDSPIESLDELGAASVGGGGSHGGLVTEYLGALAHLGYAASRVVDIEYHDAPAALRNGVIDAMADFVDLQPKIARIAGPVRALPFGIDVYASGLVAADRLPLELVERVRDALIEALTQHRAAPELAVDALVARYPDIDPGEALEGWSLIEPLIFTEHGVGSMTEERWQRSLDYAAGVHRLAVPDGDSVVRRELLAEQLPV
jgi:ABC-type nitrate/sulfonate/bicarbonate transport system substrate-binding protein